MKKFLFLRKNDIITNNMNQSNNYRLYSLKTTIKSVENY